MTITIDMVQLSPVDPIGSSTLNSIFANLYTLASGGSGSTPGIKGDQGDPGSTGAAGIGVPAGGSQGQVLLKLDGTSYNTGWADQAGKQSDLIFGSVGDAGYVMMKTGGDPFAADFRPQSELTPPSSVTTVQAGLLKFSVTTMANLPSTKLADTLYIAI